MKSANRVVMNTGFLYGKLLITIIISLYSTRLVLHALGETNYGIFALVGGVIAMLSFLNGAMSVTTQRYLSFYLGGHNDSKLKSVFSLSVLLHLVIGLIIVLLLELGGILLFNGILNIPVERLGTAKVVFHFMVVSMFFTINAVPYDASINAHENFLLDALMGIFESFVKLGIAIWLFYAKVDKLILYGLLIAGLTILIRIIKSTYCYFKYQECHVHLNSHFNFVLLKEMFSFAGWSIFGSFCSIIRNQGLAVVLNMFYGIVINAAYGVANQVNSNLNHFSTNMIRALYPQIVKSEGSGDRERMLRFAMLASKVSFFLLAFFAIPLIIEMPYILNIWLKKVPENTIIFCQLIIILSLIQQLTVGLMAAITSVGKIKVFQIVVGSLLLLNLPLAYTLIKFGLPAYSVFLGSIFLECIAGGARIWFAHKIAGLSMIHFLNGIVFNSILTVFLSTLLAMIPWVLLKESLLRAVLTLVTSTISLTLIGKYIALTYNENKKIKEIFLTILRSVGIPNMNN